MTPPPAPRPRLTVVVAASHSPGAVTRTLASLGPRRADVEVIAAASRDTVARPDPLPGHVVWLSAGDGTGVPALRRLGLDSARGDVVAFTEDSCLLAPGWADAWLAAFADPRVVAATGPVVPAMGARPLDWAVFFCEYAPFLPGATPSRLAGNNFALRRGPATGLDPRAIHEAEIPFAPTFVPRAAAGHVRRYAPALAVRDRLRFGHDYGLRRASALAPPGRLAGPFVGPAVLLTQAARLAAHVARRGRYAGPFLETLPITLGLLTAWSVGEWLGWARAALERLPLARVGSAVRTVFDQAGADGPHSEPYGEASPVNRKPL